MRFLLVLYIILFNIVNSISQNTLSLGIIDSLFIQNNFFILSKKYNVDAQKALIQQAKLLDNPNIYLEQNIYNSNNQRYFDMSASGEYIFQFQQLIRTAGKRNKQIQLAKLNSELSQLEFDALVSNLIYQMHIIYYQLKFYSKMRDIFQIEISELEPLVNQYENQFQKGNISLREVFRLRALLFNLQSIQNEVTEQITDLKKDLSVFIGKPITNDISFKSDTIILNNVEQLKINELIDTALSHRTDYFLVLKNYDYAKQNYSLQKSLAVPDFQIGYNYDRTGSFILNYSGISLSMPLPVFNRNQGNIKYSEFLMKQAETDIKQKERELKQEIISEYEKLLVSKKLYESTQKEFLKNFDNIKDGMRENFQKRNISIVEYADFFDSYINAVQQYYNLQIKIFYHKETLNYLVGKKVIK
ncbi:MAG TPA: TolC family protein [Bacteroidia bacterium]|nr:TolC family protein [Bacteroidia bacterium]